MTFARFKRFAPSINYAAFLRVAVVFFGSFMIGCGSGGSGAGSSTEAEHIGKVGTLIAEFKSANAGNNPKNIDELKNWAIKNGKAEDKDFVSTRDKEPYVIEPMAMTRTGTGGTGGMMAAKMPLVVHESTGKNGKKFVVQGSVPTGSEMSEAGLQSITKGRDEKSMKVR
jgi:hypothetical protein